jgi:hypothetical protein
MSEAIQFPANVLVLAPDGRVQRSDTFVDGA